LENTTSSETNFENWIYLSQCMQALCIQSESEHYRRSRGLAAMTMGAIYWQLNDIWQAPTWSSLEFGGRWKMLHYFARRFFNDVLVSSYELPEDNWMVHVTSDRMQSVGGTVTLDLWNWEGSLVNTVTVPFNVLPLSSTQVYQASISSFIEQSCDSRSDCLIRLTCADIQNNVLSSNVYYLTPLSQVSLTPANISVLWVNQTSLSTADIALKSATLSPFVSLSTSLSGRFSDNGLILFPGEVVEVSFLGWEEFDPQQLEETLTIMSITDTLNLDP